MCLQELKEKQKELESKARLFSHLTGEKSSGKQEPAFKNNTAPLVRKQPAVNKPNRQQAVVQPLQGQSESNSCVLLLMSFDSRNVTYLHVMSRRMRIIATSDTPVLSFPLGKQFSIAQPCCCLFQSLLLSCGGLLSVMNCTVIQDLNLQNRSQKMYQIIMMQRIFLLLLSIFRNESDNFPLSVSCILL